MRHAVCIIDFAAQEGGACQRLRFTAAHALVLAHQPDEVLPALARIEQAIAKGQWAVGYLAYEAAAGLDEKMAQAMGIAATARHDMPLLAFALFDGPDAASTFAGGVPAAQPCPARDDSAHKAPAWHLHEDQVTYTAHIEQIRQTIAAGDVYQVNHTLRASATTEAGFSPWHYYEALQKRQQGRYGAWLDFGDHQVLSLSPELFFDWNRTNGEITTRPMKGTAPRGTTPEADETQAQHLRTSPKERAENVMIVDLLRNDLGRVAVTGSVHVPHLLHVEAYPTLWQMTSTVQATTRPDTTLTQVLQALFPCGSITGAPKQMAMQKIAALESAPRGVYCGAVGVIHPQRAVFNVAIRTITRMADGPMHYGVGGGITWLSDAHAEYAEALLKMRFLDTPAMAQPSFALRETLLLADGRYALLQHHLQRIAQSAQVCGFRPLSHTQRAKALSDFAAQHPAGLWRVALTQTAAGELQVQGSALQMPFFAPAKHWSEDDALPANWLQAPTSTDDQAQTVAVATYANTVDACWLLHKTTQRAHYDAALAAHPKAWDVILHNAEGFATECSRGNLVLQTAQGCITPPLTHGLLPGTLREALLPYGAISESPIPLQRLLEPQDGDQLWFINGVRGWVKLKLQQTL
ncbi:MAG: aminodeoxychorismate synthase component I [Brachymonas sp.]|nr:aminodeoxychorismate synthase component I [Brachymonas sp.]